MRNISLAAGVFVFCSLIVGCQSSGNTKAVSIEDAITPTQLNEELHKFEGVGVTVRGFLYVDEEAICLVDAKYAALDRPPPSSLLSVVGLELLRLPMKKIQMREVVFHGTFKKKLAGESGFLLHGCVSSGIQIDAHQNEVIVVPRRGD